MGEQYVIGMDGGGTATQVIVASTKQKVLMDFKVGSLNGNGQSKEITKETIKEAMVKVVESGKQLKDCIGICVGAAGISNLETQIFLKELLIKEGIMAPILIVGDHETALAGALDSSFGIILIAGTGSICFGKTQDQQRYRVGGYGHLIDDEGSAYGIAKEILKAVMHANDRRGNRTCFTSLVFKHLNVASEEELMTWLYAKERTKKEIAGLAVLLEKALEQEDEVAKRILQDTVTQLVVLVKAILPHFAKEVPLVVSGSVLLKNKIIFQTFSKLLKEEYSDVTLYKMQGTAAEGAVKIILEELSHDKKRD